MKLTTWLAEKEMYGTFAIESVEQRDNGVELVAQNEVFRFTITFAQGVLKTRVRSLDRCTNELDMLRQTHKPYMTGTTFFKLEESSFGGDLGDGATHYYAVGTNLVVDIVATKAPTVALEQSPIAQKNRA